MIGNSQSRSAYPLTGEVDIAVSSQIEREMTVAAIEAAAPEVAVDCTDLTFIDASGVTMLLNVATRSDKRVTLVNVSPPCRRVFEILDLCERFGLTPPPPLRLVS